jgi:CRP-like cAMP-binding protein
MQVSDARSPDVSEANLLLATLAADDFALLESHFQIEQLPHGAVLYRPGEKIKTMYFPRTCVLSVVNRIGRTGGVEVGTVGREGMVGVAAYLGDGALPSETICQVGGEALSLPANQLRELAERNSSVRQRMNDYVLAFLAQVSQTASCNRAHNIEQRAARWLLMTADRVGANEFGLTHQFLAFMLGVRRAGVTVALGLLQKEGLITYRRGAIAILDRHGLEATACECYGIIRDHYDRIPGSQVA